MLRRPTLSLLALAPTLALALAAALPAAGQGGDGGGDIFPYAVHETELDNGLEVVAIPFDSPGIVAYYMIVRTGSRQEVEAGHSGFAHFFEHMMFRGTETYPQEVYNNELKKMGADSNAFTTDDWTNYHIVGPASALERLMELESDRFINLEYTEPAFRTEALAVLGEYNKNASNPFFFMFERLRELAFSAHTYKHTTMGFLDDIKAMPGYYEYSLGFFDRFYRPENVILLVVGDVEPERVAALAKKYYGPWESGFKEAEITAEPPQTERKTDEVLWGNPTRPHMMLGYHVPAFDASSVDTAALDVLSQLLFSENAPLYQELVVDRQLVDFIGGGAGFHRDPYLFTITTRLRSEDAVGEVEATLERYIEELKTKPVDAARLERVKAHLRYDFALDLDSASAVADIAAELLHLTGDAGAVNALYRQYQRVSPADIQRVARETFKESNETVVTLVHRAPPEAADEAAAGEEAGE